MSDFGFIGDAYTARSITQNDQELINWYPEVDQRKDPGERGVVALYPTPGFIARIYFSSGPIRGMWVVPGGQTLYVVAGDSLVKCDTSYNGVLVGTLFTSIGGVSMTDNGTSLFLSDGPTRYAYTWGTGTFAVIVDGAFSGASRVDVIDNFLIYSQPNGNQWGATAAGSLVSSGLSFGRKDSAPDNIVTLIANRREVFVLGERTSEVWVDAGLFPFPFQKLPGTNLQHGCAAALSVARLGEDFAFLSQDDRGNNVVVMMRGYSPVRISNNAIEHEFSHYAVTSDAIGMSYQQGGHEFYILTFPSADKTWAYDLATGMWHRRAFRDNMNVYHRDHATCAVFFNGEVLVGDYIQGLVYAANQDTYTDYSDIGNLIPRVRRCRHVTSDLNRVFHHSLQLQFEPGVGLVAGQGSNPQAMLRWSDDGGFTWSNEHWKSIGVIGAYKNRAIWRNLGQSRDRIYEVVVTDPVFAAVVSAELKASAGAN